MRTQTLRYTPLVVAVAMFIAATIALARGVTLAQAVTVARSLRGIWWLPFAYFAAYIVLDVLCVPTQLLSITSAVVWGWAVGGTIELAAATIGAVPPYLIARNNFPHWVERSDARLDSFSLLLAFRLIPVIPYSILNYIAGLSSITPLRYVAATVLGIIPSTFVFAYFVDSLAAGVIQPSEVAVRVFVAGALLAALVVATRLVAPRLRAQSAASDRADAPPAAADRD